MYTSMVWDQTGTPFEYGKNKNCWKDIIAFLQVILLSMTQHFDFKSELTNTSQSVY